jgi:ketosteroid isomerase-like protein
VVGELLRQRLTAIYAAYERSDLDAVLSAFDENADFISYLPRDVFPYLGHRAGKAAIAATLQAVHAQFEFLSYQPTFMVTEGETAAAMIEMRLRQRSTGRTINVRLGHFMRFSHGRIVEFREFTDSFDAVQQVLGHEINIEPGKRDRA